MKVFNKDKALRQIKLKQNKNTYIKRISIVLSCFILIIGIIMFTFAKFEQNSEEYTLINGKIKYLGGDINIVSYNYDGISNSLPPNKNEGYILTNINCEGATGEWDDVNWELNISSLTNKVKCNLEFDKNSNYQIIKYNPNGGYLEEQYKRGVVGQQIGELPTPIKTGYTFEGWYKESTFTNKVETTTTIDQTITNLYAKYTENTITINTPGESNVLDYAKANIVIPSGGNCKIIYGYYGTGGKFQTNTEYISDVVNGTQATVTFLKDISGYISVAEDGNNKIINNNLTLLEKLTGNGQYASKLYNFKAKIGETITFQGFTTLSSNSSWNSFWIFAAV